MRTRFIDLCMSDICDFLTTHPGMIVESGLGVAFEVQELDSVFLSRLSCGGKVICHLGIFDTEEAAVIGQARARDYLNNCVVDLESTFDFGYGLVPAHQHLNGGGWVAETARVHSSAYIGPDAQVFDNASIGGMVRVYDEARVYGEAKVFEEAKIFGGACVFEEARVSGKAQVFGHAKVYGKAQVCGHAQVYGFSRVFDNGCVYDRARVLDRARVFEHGHVCGDGVLFGHNFVLLGENMKNTFGKFVLETKHQSVSYSCALYVFGCHVYEWRDLRQKTTPWPLVSRNLSKY